MLILLLSLLALPLSQEISVTSVGIVTYPGISAPTLSPDGKKVVYLVDSHLRVVDLQTHQIKELSATMSTFTRFHFSPDSAAIVYMMPNQAVADTWNHYKSLPIAGGPETNVDIKNNASAGRGQPSRIVEEYIGATHQIQYSLVDPDTMRRTKLVLADGYPYQHAMWFGPIEARTFIYWKDGMHHFLRLNEVTGEQREIASGKGRFISWHVASGGGLYVIAVEPSRHIFATGNISFYAAQGGPALQITDGGNFESVVGQTPDGSIVALRYISTAGFFDPMLDAIGVPTVSGRQRLAEFVVLGPAKP